MDRIINVKVGGNYLSKDNKNAGVRGEGNVTKLRITFDEGWKGYAKTVTFFDALGGNPVKRIETVDLIEDITTDALTYITPIPQEPLAIAGEMTFVIDGYLDGKRQRSIADKLIVKDAPNTDTAGEPTDPTPTEPEQWQAQVDKIIDDIQQVAISRDETAQYAKDAQGYSNTAQEYSNTSQEHSKTAQGHKDNAGIYAEHAEAAAERAEQAVVHEPIIIDGYWHIWNAAAERYMDTGVKAQAGSTVYLGDNPPKDADVWIDPDGDVSGIDLTKVESTTNKVKHLDLNKTYNDEQYPNANAVVEAIIQNGASTESAAITHAEAYTDYKVGELTEQTEIIKSDVEGLQKKINEEAHFRGYLATNPTPYSPSNATPNDFVYSAKSGTKWVYDANEGWIDTETPVPDQLTPASDTTPLINGTASVGSESAYARGDHRHPTDTTRASAEEVKQLKANKVTEINSESTDEQYPSAKAAFDGIQSKTAWELIKTETLTSQLNILTWSAKQLPKCKELYLYFKVPTINPDKTSDFQKARIMLYNADTVDANKAILYEQNVVFSDSGSTWLVSYHIQVFGTNCEIVRKGLVSENGSGKAYNQNPSSAMAITVAKEIDTPYIDNLTAYLMPVSTRYFPVGTKYELWGVRA